MAGKKNDYLGTGTLARVIANFICAYYPNGNFKSDKLEFIRRSKDVKISSHKESLRDHQLGTCSERNNKKEQFKFDDCGEIFDTFYLLKYHRRRACKVRSITKYQCKYNCGFESYLLFNT